MELTDTASSFASLPDDILYCIFAQLTPKEILLVRQACRRLKDSTYHRTVWLTQYAKESRRYSLAPLGKSAGGVDELESIVLRAVRLHEKWTSPCPQPVSSREYTHLIPRVPFALKLTHGRWLFIGDCDGLRCYDLDQPSRPDQAQPLASYPGPVRHIESEYCSENGEEYLLVAACKISLTSSSTNILKMPLTKDGPLTFEHLRRVPTPGWNVRLSPKGFLLMWTSATMTLHDVSTGVVYGFTPTARHVLSATGLAPLPVVHNTTCALFDTHVITVRMGSSGTVIEAWPLPSERKIPSANTPSGNDSPSIQPSHLMLLSSHATVDTFLSAEYIQARDEIRLTCCWRPPMATDPSRDTLVLDALTLCRYPEPPTVPDAVGFSTSLATQRTERYIWAVTSAISPRSGIMHAVGCASTRAGGDVVALTFDVDAPSRDDRIVVRDLGIKLNQDVIGYVFDPLRGRLCFEVTGACNTIRVVDYV